MCIGEDAACHGKVKQVKGLEADQRLMLCARADRRLGTGQCGGRWIVALGTREQRWGMCVDCVTR
jgi:hypothetical protein